jgi:uncharacterized damage-inducible protein DinB
MKGTAMPIAEGLLPEFDQELANTRRVLELVTPEVAGYRPHAKSFTAGELALHIANLGFWAETVMKNDEFDVGQPFEAQKFESTEKLLAAFDENLTTARNALAADDDTYLKPWTLRNGEQVVFTLPRVAVIRSMVMNHLIHHRAQLTVYLRINDIPIPGLYGPSADEK